MGQMRQPAHVPTQGLAFCWLFPLFMCNFGVCFHPGPLPQFMTVFPWAS